MVFGFLASWIPLFSTGEGGCLWQHTRSFGLGIKTTASALFGHKLNNLFASLLERYNRTHFTRSLNIKWGKAFETAKDLVWQIGYVSTDRHYPLVVLKVSLEERGIAKSSNLIHWPHSLHWGDGGWWEFCGLLLKLEVNKNGVCLALWFSKTSVEPLTFTRTNTSTLRRTDLTCSIRSNAFPFTLGAAAVRNVADRHLTLTMPLSWDH